MNVCCTGLPVPSGVLVRNIRKASIRNDFWSVSKKIADTASVRIASARTVVTTRHLDRVPARQMLKKPAHERRLSDVRSCTGYYNYWSHVFLAGRQPTPLTLRRPRIRFDRQVLPALLQEARLARGKANN